NFPGRELICIKIPLPPFFLLSLLFPSLPSSLLPPSLSSFPPFPPPLPLPSPFSFFVLPSSSPSLFLFFFPSPSPPS
ncbi:hypothetical protein ACXWR7_13755, partial [Streptococcus pyogenes]